jgi:hypothetical protein
LGSETAAVATAMACSFMYVGPSVEENMKRCSGSGHEWERRGGGRRTKCRLALAPARRASAALL